ncbi:MAG: D-alanine--D-alanine ligase [Elusimicrobia bacterium]|nr:D-alanine--D-alanine ligase [Elusimicrobiota bacterium]
MVIRIGIVCGGPSAEHEVSLNSARAILAHLDRRRYRALLFWMSRRKEWFWIRDLRGFLNSTGSRFSPAGLRAVRVRFFQGRPMPAVDVFFPVLHGSLGEDGALQGFFEVLGAPYVGCGVAASALGMDKDFSKRLLKLAGLEVSPFLSLRLSEWKKNRREVIRRIRRLGPSLFVKPSRLGSSVGVSKVASLRELSGALEKAFRYDQKVLVEKAVQAREIECAVLGGEPLRASVLGEVQVHPGRHAFYSYRAKYLDPRGAQRLIPAPLSRRQSQKIQELALRAFQALECEGMARVDFLLDRRSGRVYIGEVNTLPGFTAISMYPQLLKASGISYPRLLDRLIQLALERHRRKTRLRLT